MTIWSIPYTLFLSVISIIKLSIRWLFNLIVIDYTRISSSTEDFEIVPWKLPMNSHELSMMTWEFPWIFPMLINRTLLSTLISCKLLLLSDILLDFTPTPQPIVFDSKPIQLSGYSIEFLSQNQERRYCFMWYLTH